MKKCPRCLKLDDDEVRFCKACGTELFFEYRFPENEGKQTGKRDLKMHENSSGIPDAPGT